MLLSTTSIFPTFPPSSTAFCVILHYNCLRLQPPFFVGVRVCSTLAALIRPRHVLHSSNRQTRITTIKLSQLSNLCLGPPFSRGLLSFLPASVLLELPQVVSPHPRRRRPRHLTVAARGLRRVVLERTGGRLRAPERGHRRRKTTTCSKTRGPRFWTLRWTTWKSTGERLKQDVGKTNLLIAIFHASLDHVEEHGWRAATVKRLIMCGKTFRTC